MKTKIVFALTALFSSSAFAFNSDFYTTPYDCISDSTFEVLFSGSAFNYQIPGLVAQCESQGGTLLYFHLSTDL